MERQYLRPDKRHPVPLDENFWLNIVCPNNVGSSAAVAHDIDQLYASSVAAEVEKAVRENKENISNALMKQVRFEKSRNGRNVELKEEVAPSAVNVTGIQYENLISLSFDHDELIRQEENKRRQMREKVVSAALRRKR